MNLNANSKSPTHFWGFFKEFVISSDRGFMTTMLVDGEPTRNPLYLRIKKEKENHKIYLGGIKLG